MCKTGRYEYWQCEYWRLGEWSARKVDFVSFDGKVAGLSVDGMKLNANWTKEGYCQALEQKHKGRIAVAADCAAGNLVFTDRAKGLFLGIQVRCKQGGACVQNVRLSWSEIAIRIKAEEQRLEKAAKAKPD